MKNIRWGIVRSSELDRYGNWQPAFHLYRQAYEVEHQWLRLRYSDTEVREMCRVLPVQKQVFHALRTHPRIWRPEAMDVYRMLLYLAAYADQDTGPEGEKAEDIVKKKLADAEKANLLFREVKNLPE